MISIIIPFHNERGNLSMLLARLRAVLKDTKHEIIFIDDGSTDNGQQIIEEGAKNHTNIEIVTHRRRLGKGKALSAGIKRARGDTYIFMDADLQNHPEDIPKFLEKLEEGYDVVNGNRVHRYDNAIIKWYSGLGNSFLQSLLRSPFKDINCGFKAFKKHVFEEIVVYGNNFRFLPLAAFYRGFRVTEIPIEHSKRTEGVSKFGFSKAFIGLLDTVSAYFLFKFAEKPLHFFGMLGGISLSAGSVILLYLAFERLVMQERIYRRPILFLGMLLVIVGVQIIVSGFIGELIVYLNKVTKNNKV